MDNYIIRMILDDFEKNFNISVQIVYDSRKNIMKSNPKFKIGNSAAGFQDTNSKTIYLFSDVIEKIRNKNYYNKSDENDNGLTYLILASFHELEHYIQDLGEDLTDMIKESSTEEKQVLSTKLQQLATKINK